MAAPCASRTFRRYGRHRRVKQEQEYCVRVHFTHFTLTDNDIQPPRFTCFYLRLCYCDGKVCRGSQRYCNSLSTLTLLSTQLPSALLHPHSSYLFGNAPALRSLITAPQALQHLLRCSASRDCAGHISAYTKITANCSAGKRTSAFSPKTDH